MMKDIRLLDESLRKTLGFSGSTYRAIFFLERITGIRSSANYGDVTEYRNLTDYKKDRKQWLQWLEDNACEIDNATVHQVRENIIKSTDWISSPNNR